MTHGNFSAKNNRMNTNFLFLTKNLHKEIQYTILFCIFAR